MHQGETQTVGWNRYLRDCHQQKLMFELFVPVFEHNNIHFIFFIIFYMGGVGGWVSTTIRIIYIHQMTRTPMDSGIAWYNLTCKAMRRYTYLIFVLQMRNWIFEMYSQLQCLNHIDILHTKSGYNNGSLTITGHIPVVIIQ